MRTTAVLFALTLLASVASAQAKRTKDGYAGCPSKDDFKQLVNYFVQKDIAAAQQFIDEHDCILIKGGQSVYLMDTAMFSGLVQIRFAGSTATVWTNME